MISTPYHLKTIETSVPNESTSLNDIIALIRKATGSCCQNSVVKVDGKEMDDVMTTELLN